MNRYSEGFRLMFRSLLYLIAIFSVGNMVVAQNTDAAPICFTVAIAALACSCRPIMPTPGD